MIVWPHERLKQLREARGLSLQQLADAVEMSKGHLHDLETGKQRMDRVSYITLNNIAAALGISLPRLMAMHEP